MVKKQQGEASSSRSYNDKAQRKPHKWTIPGTFVYKHTEQINTGLLAETIAAKA